MMSGARTQRNTSLSETLLNRVTKQFPDRQDYRPTASKLLVNTYSSTDGNDRSSELKRQIEESPMEAETGRSWTYVNDELVVSDRSNRKERTKNKEIGHSSNFDRKITNIAGLIIARDTRGTFAFQSMGLFPVTIGTTFVRFK